MNKYCRSVKHLLVSGHIRETFLVVIKNFFKIREPIFNDEKHLKASIDWLLKSFRATGNKGFSKGYSLKTGWGRAYPETTGYIIPTLLNFVNYSNYRKKEIIKAVNESSQWLTSLQNRNGSFSNIASKNFFIFDTGQILFGLCAIYKHTKEKKYFKALNRTANWLSNVQEKQGYWGKYTFNGLSHAYCSRVSWALLEAYKITNNLLYKEKAQKQLEWVLSQQQENGWFQHSYFFEVDISVIHTISYVIRGLLESGLILDDEKYISSAKEATDNLLRLNKKDIVYSFYNKNWQATVDSKCLTGLAQIAIIWLRLFERTNEQSYFEEASKVIEYLKSTQDILINDENLKGAMAGSFPVWGEYLPWMYPNWAIKFFIDLLVQRRKIKDNVNYIIYQG